MARGDTMIFNKSPYRRYDPVFVMKLKQKYFQPFPWFQFAFLEACRLWSINRQKMKSFFHRFMFIKFKLMTFWNKTHASIFFIDNIHCNPKRYCALIGHIMEPITFILAINRNLISGMVPPGGFFT